MGWHDTIRGTVFFNIVEILRIHKPGFIILENVAHFVRHDNGNTYQKGTTALEKLGYDVKSDTLSPHHYGVPQIRERMYLIGNRDGLNGFKWPKKQIVRNELSIKDILDKNPSWRLN